MIDFFLDTAPRDSLLTSRTTNRKINNSKSGGGAPGGNTRIRARNTAGKLPRPRGRQVNSDDQWILMAMRFNVYVYFLKEQILHVVFVSVI